MMTMMVEVVIVGHEVMREMVVVVIEVASVIELSEASGWGAAGLFTLRPLIL